VLKHDIDTQDAIPVRQQPRNAVGTRGKDKILN